VDGYRYGRTNQLDKLQKFKIWRNNMKYDTVQRNGDFYTNIDIDTVKVKGWDY